MSFFTKPEKNYRSKTKQADKQSGYLGEKVVGSTYINVTEEDGSVGKRLKVELDATAVQTGVLDHKGKVSSDDSTPDYLGTKIVAGNDTIVVTPDAGGNEKVRIYGNYQEGTGIDITGNDISLDADLDDLNDVQIGAGAEGQLVSYDSGTSKFVNTDYAVETTFSGTASKIPSSQALANLLVDTTITDDPDLLSGDAVLFRAIDIPVTAISVIETTSISSVWGADKYPDRITILASTDITYSNTNTPVLNRRSIYSNYNAVEEHNSWSVALVPVSFHEDFSDEDNIAYLDVVFACPKTEGAAALARVKADTYLWNGNGSLTQSSFAPDIQDIAYEASTGASKALKAEFTLDLNAFGGGSAPDFTS